MKKKKQHHEEHVDESWLLPYSDMMTLLLALFIVMFAMSKVDNQKMAQMSQQFNVIFSGSNTVVKGSGGNDNSIKPDTESSKANENNSVVEQDKMAAMKVELEQEIKNQGYADKVKVDLNGDGLNITIQDTVIFNSGNADILPAFDPVLNQISSMMKSVDNEIRISGHTDNVPISNREFRSNWDLSYKRALNVMSYIVNIGQANPNKFSIQAYGEYRPKYDNLTEDGRAKNRRVEILIVRKYSLNNSKSNNSSNSNNNSNGISAADTNVVDITKPIKPND